MPLYKILPAEPGFAGLALGKNDREFAEGWRRRGAALSYWLAG
jgi:hypothetical protein